MKWWGTETETETDEERPVVSSVYDGEGWGGEKRPLDGLFQVRRVRALSISFRSLSTGVLSCPISATLVPAIIPIYRYTHSPTCSFPSNVHLLLVLPDLRSSL